MRYVDGALLLATESDISYISDNFKSFRKNLKIALSRF